jgi:maltooligosyltrehalose synthase
VAFLSASLKLFSSAPCPAFRTSIKGTEFWDFSLVDPDNRRPVDYESRIAGAKTNAPLSAMMRDWQNGHLKQHSIRRLLADRNADPGLYAFGTYEPVMAQDSGAQASIAFRRNQGRSSLFVVALRKFSPNPAQTARSPCRAKPFRQEGLSFRPAPGATSLPARRFSAMAAFPPNGCSKGCRL